MKVPAIDKSKLPSISNVNRFESLHKYACLYTQNVDSRAYTRTARAHPEVPAAARFQESIGELEQNEPKGDAELKGRAESESNRQG